VDVGGAILMKTNATGTVQWSKMFGGVKDEFYSICQTSDLGYVVAGYSPANGNGSFLLKTDSLGGAQWFKAWDPAVAAYPSTTFQTADGGYIVAGSRGSYTNASGHGADAYIFKLDNTSNLVWGTKFPGSGGHTVAMTADGGYVLAGDANMRQKGILVCKTDANGNSCAGTPFTPVFLSPPLPPSALSMAGVAMPLTTTVLGGSPSSLSINDTAYCALVTAIQEPLRTSNALSVYPNPANDELTISGTEFIERADIYNAVGALQFSSKRSRINTSALTAGMYFIRVYQVNGMSTLKFIKQ
ncbi:MAG TPA: T9SS type A sorting domain-containing protein, partial [Bacteroidia bacterium]|nr:T9SS type A sorting domain-containing protein [Bacteroidia bacterium]